jgi:Protein of unknown function (DUF4038)/Putative collagen-binding domain of a collagenase
MPPCLRTMVPFAGRAACLAIVTLPVFLPCLKNAPAQPPAAVVQRLRVAPNHRYLEREDGTAFFYLGDTAWELLHRLNREEIDLYLANRARKGFTVIQTVVLAELEGLDVPNANGDLPLLARDPNRPNEAYFRHVDHVVDKAGSLGLYLGILPTWGQYWKTDGGKNIFSADSARSYGRYLGRRYRDKPVIWILGGDNNPANPAERAVIQALAAGLRDGDEGRHLITYHPRGPGRSSGFFHDSPWLDFDMYQSSHGGRDHDNGLYAELDYRLAPPKPTLDGEPRYERIPVGFYYATSNPFDRFEAYDARQAAYWSLLAGACGHTYGHNSVWQMWTPERRPVIFADAPWAEALDHPGAFQMGFVRRLFESRPFQKLEPCQAMILDGPRSGAGKIRAARAEDGSFAFIYSPVGEKFTVDQTLVKGARLKEIWYDPRYGIAREIHTGTSKAIQTYTPPNAGRGCDWILILEDEAEKFPLPGPGR